MKLILTYILCLCSVALAAQPNDADSVSLNGRHDSLFVDVDVDAFFIDNEYEGHFRDGYTLPGARIIPKAKYVPNEHFAFELGLSAMLFDGANKYPCFAYRDIASWKGSQYQNGVHLLPWFRAMYKMKGSEIIFGNLNTQHDHIIPLYNPEMNFSKDPEMGLEYRMGYKKYKLDAWIDWQSFVFKNDNHQEAFLFGLLQSYKFYDKGKYSLTVPLHIMAQHYGGEISDEETGAKANGAPVLWNVATGVQGHKSDPSGRSNGANAELMILWYYANGSLLNTPFKTGIALWGSCDYNFRKKLDVKVGMFYSKKFISNYGSPFFSTTSMETNGAYFSHVWTTMLDARYTPLKCKFGNLSLYATAYLTERGKMYLSDMTVNDKGGFYMSYSLGATFSSRLSFLVYHRKPKTLF